MARNYLTNEEIRELGLRALTEKLGAEGLVRFLQQFGAGSGDYTRDRFKIVGDESVATIAARIRRSKKKRAA